MPTNSPPAVRSAKNLDQVYVGLTKDRRIFTSSLDDSLELVARTCSRSLDVDRVSIWKFDADADCLNCLTLYIRSTDQIDSGAVLTERRIPSYFKALVGQRIIDADDARSDPRTSELTEDYLIPLDIHSILDATLRFEGQLRGVLCAESVGKAREWTQNEKVFVSSLAELVDQMMLLQQLRERESHYRSLFDHSADSIFILSDGLIADCNPAAVAMYEGNREELLGLSPARISPEVQPDGRLSSEAAEYYIQAAMNGEVQCFEWRHRTLSGREFETEVTLSRAPRGKDWFVTGIVRDISARKHAEHELENSKSALEHRAFHDSLTGLPNRDSFHRDANACIDAVGSTRVSHGVFLLDLNRFKEINDSLGHDFGDEMLGAVADRLRQFSHRHGCSIYRLGGDEFIMLAALAGKDDAIRLAEEIIEAFIQPFCRNDIDLRVDTSIGISLLPRDGTDSQSLLRCADVALYNAKRRAADFSLFDRRFDQKDKRHLTLMTELADAIERDELMLYYHPRVDLFNDTCTNCEALLRWQHPVHGMVPPEDFIAGAELNNLIHQLTRWVLRTALTQMTCWTNQGIDMTVSVNVSARNLVDQRFSEDLKALLSKHGVPAERLEIEITESALIVDPVRALETLDILRRYGVSVAVDDFGTGYSSMSYLKRLPVNVLKIDRSFVQDMLTDESDATIVRSIVELAHSFGLTAVAEGVEDSATISALKGIECDQAQGYHFCRPMPASDFEGWLGQHNRA